MCSYRIGRREFLTTSAGTVAAAGAVGVGGCRADSPATPKSKTRGAGQRTPGQSEDGVECYPKTHTSTAMVGFPPPSDKRVTIDNHFESTDTLRWTHLHTEAVFKSMPVEKGDGPIWVLPRKMLDAKRLAQETVLWGESKDDAKEISVADWLLRSQTDAFLVLHKGHILTEQYFGEMTPSTRHLLWSAGKSVLASVLAPFLSDGTIDESAQATKYLPELSESGFQGATVRQLLDMQTGIDAPAFPSEKELETLDARNPKEWTYGTEEHRRADNVFARMNRAQGVVRPLPDERTKGYYDFLLTVKQGRSHGKFFYYTDPNPMVLQWILERETGESYVWHLSRLLRKLGCERNGSITLDNLGTSVSTIGLCLTARDWARWGQMLCNDGLVGSGEKLPGMADLVRDVQRHPQPEMWKSEFNGAEWFSPGTGYRSLFWTAPAEPGQRTVLFAHGAYHQKCYVDQHRKIVVVKFSSLEEPDQFYGTDDVAVQSFLSRLSKLIE